MSGFKLLGIQILYGTPKSYYKILKVDEVYKFYDEVDFYQDSENRVCQIDASKRDLNIYSVKSGRRKININVSAIVGKNGSGKSTLLELFYMFCLCISKDQKEIQKFLSNLEKKSNYKSKFINYLFRDLKIEVFYSNGSQINSICYNGDEGILAYTFNPNRNENKTFQLKDFAYSLAVNYSIYGLNEDINAPWLGPLFHKNDGYQAPLVINPYRVKGNINVNREYELANARLIQNFVDTSLDKIDIVNKQFLDSVDFQFSPKSLESFWNDNKELSISDSIAYYEKQSGNSIYYFFNTLSEKLVQFQLNDEQILDLNEFRNRGFDENILRYQHSDAEIVFRREFIDFCLIEYIIKKVFKICVQYDWLNKFVEIGPINGKYFIKLDIKNIDELINVIVSDESHITLKIRQTLNAWKKRYITNNLTWGQKTHVNDTNFFQCYANATINDLIKIVGKNQKKSKIVEDIDLEFIPLGLLKPEIKVKRVNNSFGNNVTELSSGEQQYIFNIHTLIYHLRNLDSVFKSGEKDTNFLNYSNVNIILDEIELYYHPELQRRIISDIIRHIEQLKLKHISSINILLATHSPFVLSDIPQQNVLRLEKGTTSKRDFPRTFGANIQDLLAYDFFLKNGFIGEFSKNTIEDLIRFLKRQETKKEWDFDKARHLINQIGDPIINERINLMLNQRISSLEFNEDILLREKKELEIRLKIIQGKLKKNDIN